MNLYGVGKGFLQVDDGVLRFVVDEDQICSILSDIAIVRDHHRDRLTNMVHGAVGEQGAQCADGYLSRVRPEVAYIVRCVHGMDAVEFESGRCIDAVDRRSRERTPNERRYELAMTLDVINVDTFALDEGRVLFPPDDPTHHTYRAHDPTSADAPWGSSPRSFALAYWTDRTMLW
ncbi:hypothetical protein BMS3Bbin01_01162 [bacterium BMS3Bbin01]|nr:hypothetical protein BMS3Bbin01_01162 [bacterium BMS3Bbin01]